MIMGDYYFNNERFVIDNYLEKAAFSNFLPGLAGKKGIPLWAFYVNRGQGISGFGLQDKNHPIMEFTPANKAYESVGQIGFRTFIKVNGVYYEPFLPQSNNLHRMYISRHSFAIEEINESLGISVCVEYYGLPNENIGALVRQTKITNMTDQPLDIEVLDGLSEILPAGIKNDEFKQISNLLCSWMDVDDLEKGFAFYRLRSSTGDSSVVTEITNGNYLFGTLNHQLVTPITDQDLIFGMDHAKRRANHFYNETLSDIIKSPQVTANKIPCGFIPIQQRLQPKESVDINIVTGYTHSKQHLLDFITKAKQQDYLANKKVEAKKLIDDIVNDVATHSSSDILNEYIKQNYLDNLLRGGYPYQIGDSIYHLFSRRHGDLERDYNFFSLAPEFYSQGSGNFRDVCQNRRLDSFIHSEVKEHNIKHFASLIQLDGYNPLTVHGLLYEIASDVNLDELVKNHFSEHVEEIKAFLKGKFSPGGLVNFIANLGLDLDENLYLDDVIRHSNTHYESAFGEGYWVDHFTYIIDLVESYEAIYPDKMKELLFDQNDILTFESPVTVHAQNDKSVLTKEGHVRQYGSLLHFDEDKISRLNLNRYGANWVKFETELYRTNLFNKLLILILNKHASLDNQFLGVEMEAEKPGWNDAMNGVPGLFGSGISETIELERIVIKLLQHLDDETIVLPQEIANLFRGLVQAKHYEDRVLIKEQYRDSVRFGLSGTFTKIKAKNIKDYLNYLSNKITMSLETLFEENKGIIPTFITYEVDKFEPIKHGSKPVLGKFQLPLVKPMHFKKRYLPKFLEAPARLLKLDFGQERFKQMYQAIKQSNIYDHKLKLYKTSEPLDQEAYEIGRIRAFTPGWLERESDFLHMIYKYLLGLLKAGLYEEFFEEMKHNFVCFMDPEVYGRNILENSSFIATSNNPNPAIHGKGYLPRLSGSTVEVLDIWRHMTTGGTPFRLVNHQLRFQLEPKIPASFFNEDNTFEFAFLKSTTIRYVNESKKNTYQDATIDKIELIDESGTTVFHQGFIEGEHATNIRNCLYKKIIIYIK